MCIFFRCFEPLICWALWGVIDQDLRIMELALETLHLLFIIIIISVKVSCSTKPSWLCKWAQPWNPNSCQGTVCKCRALSSRSKHWLILHIRSIVSYWGRRNFIKLYILNINYNGTLCWTSLKFNGCATATSSLIVMSAQKEKGIPKTFHNRQFMTIRFFF